MKHIHFETIDSTNNYAKAMIRLMEPYTEPVLISAEEQTAGRGRMGRSFSSLHGNGIYLTLVIRADTDGETAMLITPAAAVGVIDALEEAGERDAGIKWVNDIYIDGRKVCGILTEAVSTAGSDAAVEYLVIGIGMNINADIGRMPEDVARIAGSVRNISKSADEMVVSIARNVEKRAEMVLNGRKKDVMDRYREKSVILGSEIYWDSQEIRHTGRVIDINDCGNLVVEENGKTVTLLSGEVSVRKTDNE